jgi:catechol 2,3-dioxygenase-like lactoylglutathione lyase family enzyme
MTVRIKCVTVDSADPYRQSLFWAAVTGFAEDPDNPNEPGDPEGLLLAPDGGPALLFVPVPEPKTGKNRVHLDLVPTDRSRDEEVERLLGLGAELVDDRRRPDGSGWVVLADPEGNEFCVERSDAEHTR